MFLSSSMAFAHSDGYSWILSLNGLYVDEIYDNGDEGLGASAELGFILNGGHTISQIIGLEVGYINSDADDFDLDVDIVPLFLNLTLVSSCNSGFFLEAGAGVGGVFINMEGNDLDLLPGDENDDIVFGGQVFGGLGYQFTDTIRLNADVRYLVSDEDDIGLARSLDSLAYSFSLQFKF